MDAQVFDRSSTPSAPKDEMDKRIDVDKPARIFSELQYGVEDVPPLHLNFLFGLQQVLLSISSTITVPIVVCISICAGDLGLVKSEVMSTFLFMCGVCTILQCLLGVRLPILQGGCHKFLPATVALMSLEQWKCPDMGPYLAQNSTLDASEVWKPRMREIQGGIIASAVIHFLIGCTGFLGVMLQYIGPITIVPTISLVGLSLIDVALSFCQVHWGISCLTVSLLMLFSLFLKDVKLPFPTYGRNRGCYVIRYPMFKLLPVILAVSISWGLCAILTSAGVASDSIRTDTKSDAVAVANWFFFPYPGQWGVPTFSAAGTMAMLAATITSIIESVGDYYACARISEVSPPPAHAVNRGVAMEGLGSLISGAIGSGGATTSYSQNVGAIGFTRVASRATFLMAGAIFLVTGVVGKVGAFLTIMPAPVLGGIVVVSFGMVISVGLSNLSFVDLRSSRNLAIIGTSLMVGLMVPEYMKKNPGAIRTGSEDFDRIMSVLLGTAMFVGGVVAFFLDNTVAGTDEERGIRKWREQTGARTVISPTNKDSHRNFSKPPGAPEKIQLFVLSSATSAEVINHELNGHVDSFRAAGDTYDIPFITPFLWKFPCFRFWPFLPPFAFGDGCFKSCRKRFGKKNTM